MLDTIGLIGTLVLCTFDNPYSHGIKCPPCVRNIEIVVSGKLICLHLSKRLKVLFLSSLSKKKQKKKNSS